ncbi:hypothetical protein vseg_000776 [Gypsophila vaccaria]
MASHSQTQSDIVGGSGAVPHTTTNISTNIVGPSTTVDTHNNFDHQVPLSFMPVHASPFQARDVHRNRQSLSRASPHDLSIPFDMNRDLSQDLLFANSFPLQDYQVSDFPRSEFDMTMDFGAQDNFMNSYHAGNVFPQLESTSDANTISFSSASESPVGNFHTTPLSQEIQSNRQHHLEMNRTPTNFRFTAVRRPNSDIVSGEYDNPVRAYAPQINNVDRLDGRFLSLGRQSNSAVNSAYQGIPNHMCQTPFPPRGQVGNYLHDSMSRRLEGFKNNVHDLETSSNISGSLALSHSDHSDSQAMNSAFGMPRVPTVPTAQVNMHRLMPTPRRNMSEFRNPTDSRVSSSTPIERRIQRVPFDSSVLRSNHQHALDQVQRSHFESNKLSHLPEDIDGGILKQDQSDKGAAVTVKNQHPHSSTAAAREPPKRNLESPQQAKMQFQRRKIIGQTSSQPFSSNILQNALGQSSSGQPMPPFPTSARSPFMDLASSDNTMTLTAVPAASRAGAFSPSTHNPSSIINSPIAFTNTPPTAFANNSGYMRTPVPAYAPPTLTHPSISAPPAALSRTVSRRTGVARIPVPASIAMSHSPSTVAVPRRISIPHTNAGLRSPAVASMRNSPHGLTVPGKASTPYAALRSPPTTPHVKWQASSAPPTLGFKCMLCKRDLSFAPEGPVSIPSIAPPVAVLPCGHTFHDHCLHLITSDDQSKDPPCIPCALGDN